MKQVRVLRIVFFAVGALMVSISAGLGWDTTNFLTTAVEVEGRVVRNIEYADSEGTMYSPLVIFETETGEKVEFIDNVRSRPARFNTEDRVAILYTEDDPTNAMVRGFFGLWGGTTIVGGIGSVFLIVSLVLFFVKSRN